MKIYIAGFLVCALYVFTYTGEELPDQETIVVSKTLNKVAMDDSKIEGSNTLPLPEDDYQQEVVEVGEFIDVYAESILQDDTEEIDIGEFVDVDQNDIEDSGEVIAIGDFIDVYAEPMSQNDTVINVGEFIDVAP